MLAGTADEKADAEVTRDDGPAAVEVAPVADAPVETVATAPEPETPAAGDGAAPAARPRRRRAATRPAGPPV